MRRWATHRWEIAKAYMGKIGKRDQSKVAGAQTTDVGGLLTLMMHCKRFKDFCNTSAIQKVGSRSLAFEIIEV